MNWPAGSPDSLNCSSRGRATGEVVLIADVLVARGDLEGAVALLRDAGAALAPTGEAGGPDGPASGGNPANAAGGAAGGATGAEEPGADATTESERAPVQDNRDSGPAAPIPTQQF